MNNPCARERHYEIFLSYRHTDSSLWITKLIEKYIIELGYPAPFFDRDTIAGGDKWNSRIEKAIKGCNDFVLVITNETFAKKNGQMAAKVLKQEIKCALDNNKHIIPLLVGGARFPADSQLPEEIKKLSEYNGQQLAFSAAWDENTIKTTLQEAFKSSFVTSLSRSISPRIEVDDESRVILQAQNLLKFDIAKIDHICDMIESRDGKAEGLTVLDIGCGDGKCALDRFKGPRFSRVVGVDINKDLIEKAQQDINVLDVNPETPECDRGKFSYHQLDVDMQSPRQLQHELKNLALSLGIEGGFDIIFVANVLHRLKFPAGVIGGLHGVLRQGGYIYTRCPDDRLKLSDGDNCLVRQIIRNTQALGLQTDRMAGGKQYRWLKNAAFDKVKIDVIFRSTSGMDSDERGKLFDESYRWRIDIAKEIYNDDSSSPAQKETCRDIIAAVTELDALFPTRDFWYGEIDVVAIATKL